MPCPDGGWDHEAMIAHGGLVASTRTILKFLDEYIAYGDYIGMRRKGSEGSAWWSAHAGSLDGTDTLAHQRGNGTNYVILFNRRPPSGSSYWLEIAPEIERLIGGPVSPWSLEQVKDEEGFSVMDH